METNNGRLEQLLKIRLPGTKKCAFTPLARDAKDNDKSVSRDTKNNTKNDKNSKNKGDIKAKVDVIERVISLQPG